MPYIEKRVEQKTIKEIREAETSGTTPVDMMGGIDRLTEKVVVFEDGTEMVWNYPTDTYVGETITIVREVIVDEHTGEIIV